MQFMQDNNIPQIKTDPTTKFQKQTEQANQQCKQFIHSEKISICSTHKLRPQTQYTH